MTFGPGGREWDRVALKFERTWSPRLEKVIGARKASRGLPRKVQSAIKGTHDYIRKLVEAKYKSEMDARYDLFRTRDKFIDLLDFVGKRYNRRATGELEAAVDEVLGPLWDAYEAYGMGDVRGFSRAINKVVPAVKKMRRTAMIVPIIW